MIEFLMDLAFLFQKQEIFSVEKSVLPLSLYCIKLIIDKIMVEPVENYSTVTDFAKFLG